MKNIYLVFATLVLFWGNLKVDAQNNKLLSVPTDVAVKNLYDSAKIQLLQTQETEVNLDGNSNKRGFSNLFSNQKENLKLEDTRIEIVGDGNIQRSVTDNASGNGVPANTGVGICYKHKIKKPNYYKNLFAYEMSLIINVASTVDTIKAKASPSGGIENARDFGNSILIPTNSGQAFKASFYGYFSRYGQEKNKLRRYYKNKYKREGKEDTTFVKMARESIKLAMEDSNYTKKYRSNFISGFYVIVEGSNRNWLVDGQLLQAGNLGTQIGLFHDFIADAQKDQYSLIIGLGYIGRYLVGDVGQYNNDYVRKEILKINSVAYHGIETMFEIKIGKISARASIPLIMSGKKGYVPGLTGWQPNTSLGFTGGVKLQL